MCGQARARAERWPPMLGGRDGRRGWSRPTRKTRSRQSGIRDAAAPATGASAERFASRRASPVRLAHPHEPCSSKPLSHPPLRPAVPLTPERDAPARAHASAHTSAPPSPTCRPSRLLPTRAAPPPSAGGTGWAGGTALQRQAAAAHTRRGAGRSWRTRWRGREHASAACSCAVWGRGWGLPAQRRRLRWPEWQLRRQSPPRRWTRRMRLGDGGPRCQLRQRGRERGRPATCSSRRRRSRRRQQWAQRRRFAAPSAVCPSWPPRPLPPTPPPPPPPLPEPPSQPLHGTPPPARSAQLCTFGRKACICSTLPLRWGTSVSHTTTGRPARALCRSAAGGGARPSRQARSTAWGGWGAVATRHHRPTSAGRRVVAGCPPQQHGPCGRPRHCIRKRRRRPSPPLWSPRRRHATWCRTKHSPHAVPLPLCR